MQKTETVIFDGDSIGPIQTGICSECDMSCNIAAKPFTQNVEGYLDQGSDPQEVTDRTREDDMVTSCPPNLPSVVGNSPAQAGATDHADTNRALGMQRSSGRNPHSSETRQKISAALRGRSQSVQTRAKRAASLQGHRVSAETRAKISARLTGRVVSAATLEKLREARKGKKMPPEFGRKISAAWRREESRGRYIAELKRRRLSPQGRQNLSLAIKKWASTPANRARVSARFKGRKKPLEQRLKMSTSARVWAQSAENRARMSAQMKGRKVSQETRDRISASLKARNSKNKETAGPSLFIECISTAAGDFRDLRGCLSIQAAPELQHVGTTALILRFSSIDLRNEAFELLRDIPEVLKVSLNAHTQLSHGAWVSGVSGA